MAARSREGSPRADRYQSTVAESHSMDREEEEEETGGLDFAASAVSSLSSAVVSVYSTASAGARGGKTTAGCRGKGALRGHPFADSDIMSSSASAKEPLLESMRMAELVTDDYGRGGEGGERSSQQYGACDSHPGPDSLQGSGMTLAADVYSTEIRRTPSNTAVVHSSRPASVGLGHGIQFLETDSAAVSGEYVYIEEDAGGAVNPTTQALKKCKKTVVKPHQTVLKLLGWFPIVPETCFCHRLPRLVKFINGLYSFLAVCVILSAYVVQFAACFRRDGTTVLLNSTAEVKCYSTAVSVYLIPDVLHSAAYLCAFYIFRWQQSENLVTLMQRVFLRSSFGQAGDLPQSRLITHLRGFLVFSILWVALSLVAQIVHVVGIALSPTRDTHFIISFTWMNVTSNGVQIMLVIMMLVGFIALDIVYAAIVINYATHCELLIILIRGISSRALDKIVPLQDIMREIMTAQEFLKYTNETVATAVSILMFNFGTAMVIGIQAAAKQTTSTNAYTNSALLAGTIMTVILWAVMFLMPLIQAARLSTACWSLNKIGQVVATRPFGFQDCKQDELNAFLTFTTSLQLRAKLFRIPIRSTYLLLLLVAGAFVLMLLLTIRPDLFHLVIT